MLGMVCRVRKFPYKIVCEVALKAMQRNAFFAHPENVLVGMLGDEDINLRRIAVNMIVNFRSKAREAAAKGETSRANCLRKFQIPKIYPTAKAINKFIELNVDTLLEPPLTMGIADEELQEFITTPLLTRLPCHNQAVERHVKLVTEASASVSSFERRDGLIRQKIKSRKLQKVFEAKQDFKLS